MILLYNIVYNICKKDKSHNFPTCWNTYKIKHIFTILVLNILINGSISFLTVTSTYFVY